MPKRTHLFYLDEDLKNPVNLEPGDCLVYGGKMYAVLRNGHRLYCATPGKKEGDLIFSVGDDLPHPAYGALTLGEMYNLTPYVEPVEEMHKHDLGAEKQWILQKP